MNILREPVEVGKLRYASIRGRIGWMFLRTSAVVFVVSAGFLWLISLPETHLPRATSLGLLAGMMGITAVLMFGMLPLARYGRGAWRWDERGWRRGLFLHRWGVFQRFRVRPDPQAPGFVRFTIQFRDRFREKGMWFGITAPAWEIEALAAAVRRHVPQEE